MFDVMLNFNNVLLNAEGNRSSSSKKILISFCSELTYFSGTTTLTLYELLVNGAPTSVGDE